MSGHYICKKLDDKELKMLLDSVCNLCPQQKCESKNLSKKAKCGRACYKKEDNYKFGLEIWIEIIDGKCFIKGTKQIPD